MAQVYAEMYPAKSAVSAPRDLLNSYVVKFTPTPNVAAIKQVVPYAHASFGPRARPRATPSPDPRPSHRRQNAIKCQPKRRTSADGSALNSPMKIPL